MITDYEVLNGIITAMIRLRKLHGMNQTEAGAIVGVPKTTYATWEQGRSVPSPEVLFKLAQFYNVTMDEMYGLYIDERR